jgi:hypothetical protein
MPKYGEKLPQPLYEITTKFEKSRQIDIIRGSYGDWGLGKGRDRSHL